MGVSRPRGWWLEGWSAGVPPWSGCGIAAPPCLLMPCLSLFRLYPPKSPFFCFTLNYSETILYESSKLFATKFFLGRFFFVFFVGGQIWEMFMFIMFGQGSWRYITKVGIFIFIFILVGNESM